jgi:AcrR family transcriptional regulator
MPAPSFRDYQLPRGRHALGAEQVAANQRLRLIGAASDLLAEGRLLGLTSRRIARRAGVSSQTFYEHFENVDALLTAAFANAAQVLVELIAGACGGIAESDELMRKAVAAAISLGDEEPGLAALFRVEVGVAIPEVGAERERLVARLVALASGRRDGSHMRGRVAAALMLAGERFEEYAAGTASALPGELGSLLALEVP